jgi:hypothetical protein
VIWNLGDAGGVDDGGVVVGVEVSYSFLYPSKFCKSSFSLIFSRPSSVSPT